MAKKAKQKPSKVYVPPEYTVQVNALINIDSEVTELFNGILRDYCSRFNTKVLEEREDTKIMLSLIQGGSDPTDMDGLCAFDAKGMLPALVIQVRCIVIEGMEPNEYAVQHWMEVLCHEMVHACQALTGRSMQLPEMNLQGWKSEDYYFDSDEVEARMLQAPYANRINRELTGQIVNKIRQCFQEEEEADDEILLKTLYDEADIRH